MLRGLSGCFASSDSDMGLSNLVQHSIDTADHKPSHQAPYRSRWKEQEITQTQIRQMRSAGIIEPSGSPWAAPVVLVRKKTEPGAFAYVSSK